MESTGDPLLTGWLCMAERCMEGESGGTAKNEKNEIQISPPLPSGGFPQFVLWSVCFLLRKFQLHLFLLGLPHHLLLAVTLFNLILYDFVHYNLTLCCFGATPGILGPLETYSQLFGGACS